MAERKPHIIIDGFAAYEAFKPRRPHRNSVIPPQDRATHGQSLSQQYSGLLKHFESVRQQVSQPITEDIGIYVEIVGAPGCELPLDSLDTNRNFKLRSCRKVENHEIAIVFNSREPQKCVSAQIRTISRSG